MFRNFASAFRINTFSKVPTKQTHISRCVKTPFALLASSLKVSPNNAKEEKQLNVCYFMEHPEWRPYDNIPRPFTKKEPSFSHIAIVFLADENQNKIDDDNIADHNHWFNEKISKEKYYQNIATDTQFAANPGSSRVLQLYLQNDGKYYDQKTNEQHFKFFLEYNYPVGYQETESAITLSKKIEELAKTFGGKYYSFEGRKSGCDYTQSNFNDVTFYLLEQTDAKKTKELIFAFNKTFNIPTELAKRLENDFS